MGHQWGGGHADGLGLGRGARWATIPRVDRDREDRLVTLVHNGHEVPWDGEADTCGEESHTWGHIGGGAVATGCGGAGQRAPPRTYIAL